MKSKYDTRPEKKGKGSGEEARTEPQRGKTKERWKKEQGRMSKKPSC